MRVEKTEAQRRGGDWSGRREGLGLRPVGIPVTGADGRKRARGPRLRSHASGHASGICQDGQRLLPDPNQLSHSFQLGHYETVASPCSALGLSFPTCILRD